MSAPNADLGYSGASTPVELPYTLFDRRVIDGLNGTWAWKYRGRYQGGAESHWTSGEEVQVSLTGPL